MEKTLSGNKTAVKILWFAALAVAAVPVSFASLYGIRPFGAGLFLALSFLGLPLFFTAPLFLVSEILADFSLESFLCALVCAAVVIIYKLIEERMKTKKSYFELIAAVLSQGGLAFYLSGSLISWLLLLVSLMLSVVFMYACLHALKPVLLDKLKYRLVETEVVCLTLILTAAAAGLGRINIGYFPLLYVAAAFVILLASRLSGVGAGIVCAFCFGLGLSLYSYEPAAVACFVFIAAVSGVFSNAPRVLNVAAAIVAFVIFTFYFNTDYYDAAFKIGAIAVGGILYAVIPAKALSNVKEFFFSSHERAAVRFMICKSRAETGNALLDSADIFDSMAGYMTRRNGEKQPQKDRLYNACCIHCDNLAVCNRAGFKESLEQILDTASQKGRVTVADIPDQLSRCCVRLSRLVKSASEIDDAVRANAMRSSFEQDARSVISSQLGGVAAALRTIAANHGAAPVFDKTREKVLIEELNYRGISCAECLIAGESIALIVRSECVDKQIIEKTAAKIMRRGYRITGTDDTVLAGFCALVLSPEPKYNVLLGSAGTPKVSGEKSGDTHSFIRLDDSRLMIALCDGMGSGENASKISEASIGLVESFYKAGFSTELVLYSVNRFLSLTLEESFSALDICVIDLNTAQADIIKLGSPAAYIKKKDVIQRIDSQSLPIGADETVRPSVVSLNLDPGDILVFTSDGVSDCFEGDRLAASVLNVNTVNPQTLAECVMEKTLQACRNKPKDDSTVITARLILN